ncbi:DUF7662 domain-containing protein [Cellulomonas sp.]|uniref:DUF7662 domain-containing protein n=1 Tax=Cellulomonas sp. TaxID=40001 RepID=UPI003BA87E18
MAKYDPLRDHLAHIPTDAATLTFDEVADLVGGLPNSAYNLRNWWANNSQVQALAWRAAGWHVDSVALTSRRVTFARGVVGGSYHDSGRVAGGPRA